MRRTIKKLLEYSEHKWIMRFLSSGSRVIDMTPIPSIFYAKNVL